MSEETKNEIKQECFCKSELFQRTLAVTIGSFIGVFCAMNLFFALNKPPVMMFHHPYHHYHHFSKQRMFKDNMRPAMNNFYDDKINNYKDMRKPEENKD